MFLGSMGSFWGLVADMRAIRQWLAVLMHVLVPSSLVTRRDQGIIHVMMQQRA